MRIKPWNQSFYLMADEAGGSGGSDSGAAVADSSPSGGESTPADISSDYAKPDSAFHRGREDRSDDFIAALKGGADKAEGKAVQGQQAAAVPQGFTDQHFQFANALGMSKEQVASFGTPQAFESFLQNIHQQNQHFIQQQAQQLAQQQVQQYLAQQRPQQQQIPQQQQQAPQGFQPFALPQLPPGDQYDPGIVAMADFFNKQMQAMHEQLTGIAPQVQNFGQVQQQLSQWASAQREIAQQHLNSQIDNGLSAVDQELYGKGNWREITPAQANARVEISKALAILEAGYQQRGEALPPLDKVIEQAHRMVYGDRIRQQTASQIAEKSQKLRGQTVAVPGNSRREEAVSPEERAARAMREKMQQFDRGE